MGCDIHLFVQVRVLDINANDEAPPSTGARTDWVFVPRPEALTDPGYVPDSSYDWDGPRDYRSFAPLAGIRDMSSSRVKSARWNRGLPTDVVVDDTHGDMDIVTPAGPGWLGDHSFTHFTVAEMDADPIWNQVVTWGEDVGTWREISRWFDSDIMQEIRKLGPPDRVRLVMGFDS